MEGIHVLYRIQSQVSPVCVQYQGWLLGPMEQSVALVHGIYLKVGENSTVQLLIPSYILCLSLSGIHAVQWRRKIF